MSDERITDTGDPFQAWIDGLLTSPEAKPAAPKILRVEVQRTLSRRRRWSIARRLVAAAAVAALICWPRGDKIADDRQLISASSHVTTQEQATPPVATFVAGSDTIAVAIDSPAPNVTILEVYPTISARRHRKRQVLLENTIKSISYDGG